MYQLNEKFSQSTEERFNKLVTGFEKTVTRFELDKVEKEFDLDLMYTPNWACIWNKRSNIGKPCRILEKNNKLILVGFVGTSPKELKDNLLEHLYRVEDISLKT